MAVLFLPFLASMGIAIMVIDQKILDELTAKAKASPRLRMAYDLRTTPEENSQRMLNAIEPGTEIPIHRHPTKDETFVILKGKVKVATYNNKGELQDYAILCQENGLYGVNIPKNVWHTLKALESSMLFECKGEGRLCRMRRKGFLQFRVYSV